MPPGETYRGFEQGPIRPPSEARSLLIRVSRNCPWNRCAFCPVYKGETFSVRPVEHVLRDIDTVRRYVDALRERADGAAQLPGAMLREAMRDTAPEDPEAYAAAVNWYSNGMQSIFLQDANALFMKPPDLVRIVKHLRAAFPFATRITTYARAHTVAHRKGEDMRTLAEAGLDRVHIGLESGSDTVLEMMHKGVTQSQHIDAGRKVKAAGMELSEYYIPGLGGRAFSREHAEQSALALNQMNPDFIRLRTLAIPRNTPLFQEWEAGRFEKLNDAEIVEELIVFIKHLDGITSMVQSDHILNLFGDLEGPLPAGRERMLDILRGFLALPPEERMLYQVGRRLGVFSSLTHLDTPSRRARAQQACQQYGITPDNVDRAIDELMRRFI
mgnify:CR=1 FL=1